MKARGLTVAMTKWYLSYKSVSQSSVSPCQHGLVPQFPQPCGQLDMESLAYRSIDGLFANESIVPVRQVFVLADNVFANNRVSKHTKHRWYDKCYGHCFLAEDKVLGINAASVRSVRTAQARCSRTLS